MPKSDTWPGGIGLETMTGMDSAGSCDSVVSANSGFSDDSLEHLSAEEKACLMFLEETIESLDTEEDSGLSNDEPDQLPSVGNLATKLADLSVSMSKSKLSSSPKQASKEPIKENVDKPMQSYLVPTPLVVASSSPPPVPSVKPGVPPDKNLSPQPQITPPSKEPSHKRNQKPPQVPLEVTVVIPPPTKPKDFSVKTAEAPLPRGPLSYEALVHLRRSASTKKTPLCPKIDHTIDLDKHLPLTEEGPNPRNLPRSDRSHTEASRPKTGPPAVAPKPKRIPANISAKIQTESSVKSDSSFSIKHTTDPQVVRLEALQKLGLLRDQQPENETLAPLPPPKPRSSLDPTSNRCTRGPSNANPSRSPSFCYSQVPSESKIRPLQSSASFSHYSRHDQQPVSHPPQSNGLKSAGLECSATLDNHKNGGNCPEPQHNTATKPVTTPPAAPPVPQKPSNSVGYTVMVVPGMGADRKEALRKLGLLKV
ncbi:specifically androgen-regulated gene protein [Symphorus nematophorus]